MHFARALSTLGSLALCVTANSCSTGPVIKDGGFESGITPPTSGGNAWIVNSFIGASSYALTKPGSTNHGGKYAFTALLAPGPYSGGVSGDTLTQTMNTCAGHNYSILADYKFASAAGGNCALTIQYPYKTTTGSVTTGSGIAGGTAGNWYTTAATFQAVSSADPFSIVFRCTNSAQDQISVDNIVIAPYAGNAF
ncbi:hypothetical protein MMC07_009885 [Pseudocyphellaria aurata]|nr:hypothetical protein [Pseudocyphellaria aurata]